MPQVKNIITLLSMHMMASLPTHINKEEVLREGVAARLTAVYAARAEAQGQQTGKEREELRSPDVSSTTRLGIATRAAER